MSEATTSTSAWEKFKQGQTCLSYVGARKDLDDNLWNAFMAGWNARDEMEDEE